jgi:hypothetical protein
MSKLTEALAAYREAEAVAAAADDLYRETQRAFDVHRETRKQAHFDHQTALTELGKAVIEADPRELDG